MGVTKDLALRHYLCGLQSFWTLLDLELDRLTFTMLALTNTSGLQEADVPMLYTLFDKRDQLSPWAQALLALSQVRDLGDEARVEVVAKEIGAVLPVGTKDQRAVLVKPARVGVVVDTI